ncbi:MAG: cobalamin biosynthesis protein CobD [Planctomycetaceae bacterium]|nr:MAG: cobalamin biosynthesis protein CobD [Planctomycetaceae bacterium]
MTSVEILAACALDAAIGDPRTMPHPVRWMGRLSANVHRRVRAFGWGPRSLRAAGSLLAVGLPATAFVSGWALIAAGAALHDWIGQAIGIWLASMTLAWRDLVDHVRAVSSALKAGSLEKARQAVGLIVGRDTQELSEAEVVRAAVETIAESACDGIIAPLLFLVVGGPPLALAFKAVSTLDSMIGHRDEEHREFGWASARLDDVANWIPARVTAWLIAAAAGLVLFSVKAIKRSGAILLRDGHKHPSPNSGRPEAAMAGALGVQLGGVNYYGGCRAERPVLGDAGAPLSVRQVDRAASIMTVAYLLAIAASARVLWR